MRRKNKDIFLIAAIFQFISANLLAATDPDGDPAKSPNWLNDINPDYPVAAVIKVQSKYKDDVLSKIERISIPVTEKQKERLRIGNGCPISAEPHLPISAEPHKPIGAEPHKQIEAEPNEKFCSPISVDSYLDYEYSAISNSIELSNSILKDKEGYSFIPVKGYRNELELISALDGVLFVENDPRRFLMNADYHRILVQANRTHPSFAGTSPDEYTDNMKVCIIDTGLDVSHPDLQGIDITGVDHSTPTFISDGWDQIDSTFGSSHGTHVAGIIAARQNQIGSTGIAPNGHIDLHIVKVNFGRTRSSNIALAINNCVENNADIINMSFGGPFNADIERSAADAASQNIILVAAAGNDGADVRENADGTFEPDIEAQVRLNYPASYSSFISVGAVDENSEYSLFSQRNAAVELAAPGGNVFSSIATTLPATNANELEVGNIAFSHVGIFNNNRRNRPAWHQFNHSYNLGLLVDCGLGETTCPTPTNHSGPWGCLIERGSVSFGVKAQSCEDAGGQSAVIYNNIPNTPLSGNLDRTINIPVIGVEREVGITIRVTQSGYVTNRVDPVTGLREVVQGKIHNIFNTFDPIIYDYYSGTSMATPIISGVAALLWSHHTSCSADGIRTALQESARDLGVPGRDHKYGFGLVQYLAAEDWVAANGCQ